MASSLVLNRSSKVPAQDTAAFGAIAERFRRAGALDKAVTLCREGLSKFPDHVSARVTLGWALLDLGQYDASRIELELVLRRAPDNLAAIRGLAELHDRFEHTMNLPMDGPGQWPPPASEVGELDEAPIVAVAMPEFDSAPADSPAAAFNEDEGHAVIVPADMGMPIWSAVAPEPAAHVAPHAPVSPIESVAAPIAPAPLPASGMSSVREIDFPAPVPVETFVHAAAPAEAEVNLAALIAEAESLEAAAEAAVVATDFEAASLDRAPAIDLVSDVELNADEDLAAQLQITAGTDLESASLVESDSPVTIELSDAEDAPEFAELTSAIPTELASAPEAVAFSEPAVVAELPSEPLPLDVVSLDVAAAESVASDVASEAVEEIVEQILEAGEGTAWSEPVEVMESAEAAFAHVLPFAPVSGGAAVQTAARTATTHSALPALERMLAKVQARRLQLMAESVA